MSSLEIPDLLILEISLEEILQAVRLIMKETKYKKVRTALKVMLNELKKVNKPLINNVFIPLYNIQSQEDFKKKFPRIRARFKQIYLGNKPVLSKIQCNKVTEKLKMLMESKNWKKRIPLIKRSVIRLKLLVDSWIANDSELYQADQKMMKEINDFMDEIDNISDLSVALQEFKSGLKDIEESYLSVRDHFAELEILSNKL